MGWRLVGTYRIHSHSHILRCTFCIFTIILLSSRQFDITHCTLYHTHVTVHGFCPTWCLCWMASASLFSTLFPSALSQPYRPLTTSCSLHPDTRKTTSLTSTLLSHRASGPCSPIWFIYNLAFCPALLHTEVWALTHFTINGEFRTTQASAVQNLSQFWTAVWGTMINNI